MRVAARHYRPNGRDCMRLAKHLLLTVIVIVLAVLLSIAWVCGQVVASIRGENRGPWYTP